MAREFDPAVAEQVGREFAGAVAARRLEEWKSIKEEAEIALRALAGGSAQPERLDWALRYKIPGGMKVGFDFREN